MAVLSVVVFHLWPNALPGGFVGVDVFFVISGFLITSHIVHEVVNDRFSLADFYARRVKRIAPAMLVVVGVTVAAASLVLLPEDSAETAKSAVFSVCSLANVFFWRNVDTGYFGALGRNLPLLHLWSLGVEEQFYLLWPLLLMTLYRVRRKRLFLVAMAVMSVATFTMAQSLFPRDPSFTYYMLPTRAGELLIGAIGSEVMVSEWWRRLPRRDLVALAAFGSLLLVGSLALLSEDMVFPGLLALPPTIGTVLLIVSRRDERQATVRLLSFKPLVFIGLISYSAYLWHWPLLTFYRYGFGDPGIVAGFVLLALTLAFAAASYRIVEQPARRTKAGNARILLGQYLVPAGTLGAMSLGLAYADHLWPTIRHSSYRRSLAAYRVDSRPAFDYPYVCQRQRLTKADLANEACVVGFDSSRHRQSTDPLVLLWGDSNAAHYVGILGAFAQRTGFRFRNLEVGSCPPLLSDIARFTTARRLRDCIASLPISETAIAHAQVVIVGGSWTSYEEANPLFLPALFAMVKELTHQGKEVILLGKIPVIPSFDRQCREKALKFPLMRCPNLRAPMSPAVAMLNAQIRRFADETANVAYYDPNSLLCTNSVCAANAADGEALYYDSEHLSMRGSWSVGDSVIARESVPRMFSMLATDVRAGTLSAYSVGDVATPHSNRADRRNH